MSDETEGWEIGGNDTHRKQIGNNWFYCFRCDDGGFELDIRGATVATRPTLRECQILAHATARLWAGETE